MISRRDLLCAGALAPLSTYSFAAPAYKAGKEYLTVHPMAPTPADKIEVVEFFAYTCPHCLQFHPVFHEWAQKAPEDVSIRICPVAWQPKYLPFTDTYFALEALGLLDSLSMPFFESIIYQTRSYNFDSASSRAAHGAVFDEPSEACDGMRSARAFSIECSLPALFQGRNRINRPEGISPTRRGIRHDVKCGPQGTASTPGPTGRHPLLHAFRTKTRRSIHDRQHDQEARGA